MVRPPLATPAFLSRTPSSALPASFLLRYNLGWGRGSRSLLSATLGADPDQVPCSWFSLVQFWPLKAIGNKPENERDLSFK